MLQKSPSRLCEIEICNDRIEARAPLNRCCAFAPDLESMLRDKMLKILSQHYLPRGDVPSAQTPCDVIANLNLHSGLAEVDIAAVA